MKRIWMELDREGYPVKIAGSASELARMTGAKSVTIRSAVSHQDRRGSRTTIIGRPQRWAAVPEEE